MLRTDLTGKVAVITAAARMPGQKIAEYLGLNGAKVALCDKDQEGLILLEKYLNEKGIECKGYRMDILEPESFEGICTQIVTDFGSIDILVNNEKDDMRGEDKKPLHLMNFERYLEITRKEINGTYYMAKAAMNKMDKGGIVINITSSLGLAPAKNCIANVVSAGAVMSLSRVAALEMTPDNIRVHCIARGSLEGVEYENCPTKENIEHLATKRPVTADDIANAVVFCASEEGAYANGNILTLDGGQHIGYMRNF